MPLSPESLSPYIRRINLAEKDELEKLGQQVDKFGNIKKNLSRRKFLEITTQAIVAPVLLSREKLFDEFRLRMELLNNWVTVDRQDVNLVLETRNLLLEATATESNDRYSRFNEHAVPSPFVMEGSYTLFGESSISLGQFLIYTDQLREQLNTHELDIDQLDQSDLRILRIRDAFDATDHATIPLDSSDFALFFKEFLHNYRDEEITEGFIGAVAAKSPADFGRIGYVRIWDWVAEQWSEEGMTIVLNTANGQTLRNLADRRITFENYNAEMRWGLEISDEILDNLNLAANRADNLSGYFQFIDCDAIPDNTQLQFPEYTRIYPEINSSSYQLAERISTILTLGSLSEEVLTTYQTASTSLQVAPDTGFSFEAGEYTLHQTFNQSSIISYILHNHEIPVVLDPDRAELVNSLNTPGLGIGGFPLGENSQHFLLNYFARPNLFERKILCNTRQDDLETLNTGIFFFENYPDMLGSQTPILNGFVITHEGQKRFVYLDENNQVINKTITEISEFYRDDLNKRIIIFVPTNLSVRDFNPLLSHV
jgi:hypothetical protein